MLAACNTPSLCAVITRSHTLRNRPETQCGGLSATMRLKAWEYARVPWDEVAEHAAQDWRLMPIPPVPEMKAVLGQVAMTGVVLYHLEREVTGRAVPVSPVPLVKLR